MNEDDMKKLVSFMAKDIEKKIANDIKKNNEKIVDNMFLAVQVLITIAVVYIEFF